MDDFKKRLELHQEKHNRLSKRLEAMDRGELSEREMLELGDELQVLTDERKELLKEEGAQETAKRYEKIINKILCIEEV